MRKLRNLSLIGAILVFAGIVSAFSGSINLIRWAGSSVRPGNEYALQVDSTDTVPVDTVISDVVSVGDYKWCNFMWQNTGYTLSDSANDSVTFIAQVVGTHNGQFERILLYDTLPNTLGTLDSTDFSIKDFRIDSIAVNQLYVRMIVTDSFILGAGIDSNVFRFNMKLGQTGSK